jgi:hypothetical protein
MLCQEKEEVHCVSSSKLRGRIHEKEYRKDKTQDMGGDFDVFSPLKDSLNNLAL